MSGADFVHKGASPDELIATLLPLLRKENISSETTATENGISKM
jgi:hypothetical protein